MSATLPLNPGPISRGLRINKGDLFVSLGVVSIILVMIFPLPRLLLDLLLTLNLTFSLMVLLLSLYTARPLDFFVFPSLLLVTTLFRLSLIVASTRLILLNGQEGLEAAGRVIHSFGSLVVGGNYVVGGIIFIILVIINFIVIIKGSTRIAEVAARFTLDAMPGKQMSIEADLNAGYIDEPTARERRSRVAREGEFYGAMDGATKFVRGEGLAAPLIMVINLVGGLIIGVGQHGMDLGEAAQTFTLLTIGEGLITQIPALLVSTAAGLVVSKAASESSLGEEYAAQFTLKPQAMSAAAGIIFVAGLMPGLPHIPFIFLAVLTGGLSYVAWKSRGKTLAAPDESQSYLPRQPGPEAIDNLLSLDLVELEVGYGLIPLVDEDQGGELIARIRALRRQFALETGVVVPPIHIRDNLQLKPGGYAVQIKGVEAARGDLMVGRCLALPPGEGTPALEGIAAREPTLGLPAQWIPSSQKETARQLGYTVVDPAGVVATHLSEVLRSHCDDLLGRQEVQKMLDRLAQSNPKVVEELTPGLLPLGAIQKVLQNLVRESVSIRDLRTIMETLADYASHTKDPDILTEYVRQRLGRALTKSLETPDQKLFVYTLDPAVEELIKDSLQKTDYGIFLGLAPETAQMVIKSLKEAEDKAMAQNFPPVVVCSSTVRRHLRRLVERHLPALRVFSHHELVSEASIQSLGVVNVGPEI
jgi:flagellar biosynthesis protein FlhA